MSFFSKKEKLKLLEKEKQEVLRSNLKNYKELFNQTAAEFYDLELAKQRTRNIRWDALANLDAYLIDFEKHFQNRGGNLIWAENGDQVLDAIQKLIDESETSIILKSRSLEINEIELHAFLQEEEKSFVTVDIDEHLSQLLNEDSSHPSNSIIHKSVREIQSQLEGKIAGIGEDIGAAIKSLNNKLRIANASSTMGILGAPILVAENGTIVLSDMEGGASWISQASDQLVVIAGIDRIIGSLHQLAHVSAFKQTYNQGLSQPSFQHLIFGKKKNNELDGPQKVTLILLDNGRSELMEDSELRELLYESDSSAYINHCPVYPYLPFSHHPKPYFGPMGAIVAGFFPEKSSDLELALHYPSSGQSNDNPCGVDIDLLLTKIRSKYQKKRSRGIMERIIWYYYMRYMLGKKQIRNAKTSFKEMVLKRFVAKKWGDSRALPVLAERTFGQLWKDRNKIL